MELFPKSRAALRKRDHSLWDVGNFIREECGDPGERGVHDGSLKEIAKLVYLLHEEDGLDYAEHTLREYRDISYLYRDAIQIASVSYTIHRIARDPEALTWILEKHLEAQAKLKAKHIATGTNEEFKPKRLTASAAREWRTRWLKKKEDEEKARLVREFEASLATADADLKEAEEQEREAAEEIQHAKNEKDRKEAEAKQAEAQERVEKAKKQKRISKNIAPPPPKKKEPEKNRFSEMILSTTITNKADSSGVFAGEVLKLLEEHGHELHPDTVAVVIESALEVVDIWRKVATTMQEMRPELQRSHILPIEKETRR